MVRPRVREDDWDSHWARYAASASHNPAQQMRHQLVLAALRSVSWPTDRLLDIGSGQGDFLVNAAQLGAARSYVGFELSEVGVRISQKKLPQAEFIEVDLYAPAPECAKFLGWASAAVCSEVLEHVDDPVEFLRVVRNYLADEAILILTVPGGPMSAFDRHIGHRRHYSSALVRQTLARAGFNRETVWLAGFPVFNLYRLLVILRGRRLIGDIQAGDGGRAASGVARVFMSAFRLLFKLNMRNCPMGWQVVAIARKGKP